MRVKELNVTIGQRFTRSTGLVKKVLTNKKQIVDLYNNRTDDKKLMTILETLLSKQNTHKLIYFDVKIKEGLLKRMQIKSIYN